MEKTFLVVKEYTTRNYMYIKAETEEEALKLADVGEGTSDRYTEYEPVQNVSVQEAEKIEKINSTEEERVKKIGHHIIEPEGKKKLVMQNRKAEKSSVGGYVRYKDKLFQVYAKTEKDVFIKRDVEKIRVAASEIMGVFVDLEEEIKKIAKNKVVVRMDIKQVDPLYERFIQNLQQIIRFENANYTCDELECYLDERQKIDWYEHQSATKYYINTVMTDKELEEFADQKWIDVRTYAELWDELSLAAKVIINKIRRGYGEEGERKYFKASIGDKIDYKNDLAYDLTGQIEVTQDVLYEIDKYNDIVQAFGCDIKNNTIEILEEEEILV